MWILEYFKYLFKQTNFFSSVIIVQLNELVQMNISNKIFVQTD